MCLVYALVLMFVVVIAILLTYVEEVWHRWSLSLLDLTVNLYISVNKAETINQ